jgi:hypothetical protein
VTAVDADSANVSKHVIDRGEHAAGRVVDSPYRGRSSLETSRSAASADQIGSTSAICNASMKKQTTVGHRAGRSVVGNTCGRTRSRGHGFPLGEK